MVTLPTSPLVAVVGPTGSGKTDLAEALARKFDGELINADSRQFYRGLDLGTAKPVGSSQPDGTYVTSSGAVYHLVDIRDPDEPMNLAQFQRLARAAWTEVTSRDKLPILVGGTGLYVEATVTDLELYRTPSSESRTPKPFPRLPMPENVLLLSPTRTDEELRNRLTARADEIFSSGVIDEARRLFARYPEGLSALTGIIYPILKRHLAGEISLEEAQREFVSADWQLARRQRTWWRRRPEVRSVGNLEEAARLVQDHLQRLHIKE